MMLGGLAPLHDNLDQSRPAKSMVDALMEILFQPPESQHGTHSRQPHCS